MTTFLLHGGKTSIQSPQNERFFAEFTNCVNKEKVTVLHCYFSRQKSEWEALINRDSASITRNTSKSVEILIAEDPKDLLQKIETADVLYVAGGDDKLIEPLYKNLSELPRKIVDKVYVGSSMGAFMASDSYVLSMDSQDTKRTRSGLGLIPFQVLCHWDVEAEKERKLQLLKKSSEKPIIVLNELEFITIYK